MSGLMTSLPRGQQTSGGRILNALPTGATQRIAMATHVPNMNVSAQTTQGVIQLNHWPLPKSVTITVTSTDLGGGAAVPTLVYLFNRPQNADVTDNGSGANSIGYQYQDGKNGTRLDMLVNRDRFNVGTPIYGISMRVLVNGAADATGLSNLNPAFTYWNAFNRTDNVDLNSTDGQGRKDQDLSIQVWSITEGVNMPAWGQLGFTMPVYPIIAPNPAQVSTMVATIYFDKSFLNTI